MIEMPDLSQFFVSGWLTRSHAVFLNLLWKFYELVAVATEYQGKEVDEGKSSGLSNGSRIVCSDRRGIVDRGLCVCRWWIHV